MSTLFSRHVFYRFNQYNLCGLRRRNLQYHHGRQFNPRVPGLPVPLFCRQQHLRRLPTLHRRPAGRGLVHQLSRAPGLLRRPGWPGPPVPGRLLLHPREHAPGAVSIRHRLGCRELHVFDPSIYRTGPPGLRLDRRKHLVRRGLPRRRVCHAHTDAPEGPINMFRLGCVFTASL